MWISVADRLPVTGERVRVWTWNRGVLCGWLEEVLDGGDWWRIGEGCFLSCAVTHWQPLSQGETVDLGHGLVYALPQEKLHKEGL